MREPELAQGAWPGGMGEGDCSAGQMHKDVCMRIHMYIGHAVGMYHAPLESSRRGGRFECRHAHTRPIDQAVGDARCRADMEPSAMPVYSRYSARGGL